MSSTFCKNHTQLSQQTVYTSPDNHRVFGWRVEQYCDFVKVKHFVPRKIVVTTYCTIVISIVEFGCSVTHFKAILIEICDINGLFKELSNQEDYDRAAPR